jgi:hypothetical protein
MLAPHVLEENYMFLLSGLGRASFQLAKPRQITCEPGSMLEIKRGSME